MGQHRMSNSAHSNRINKNFIDAALQFRRFPQLARASEPIDTQKTPDRQKSFRYFELGGQRRSAENRNGGLPVIAVLSNEGHQCFSMCSITRSVPAK